MFQMYNNYHNFCWFLGDHLITRMTDAVPSHYNDNECEILFTHDNRNVMPHCECVLESTQACSYTPRRSTSKYTLFRVYIIKWSNLISQKQVRVSFRGVGGHSPPPWLWLAPPPWNGENFVLHVNQFKCL